MSSALVHVTVVPALISRVAGEKLKLSIFTSVAICCCCSAGSRTGAAFAPLHDPAAWLKPATSKNPIPQIRVARFTFFLLIHLNLSQLPRALSAREQNSHS